MNDLNERELPDDYPVYPGYLYVADSLVIQSPIEGVVADLKRKTGTSKITSCDIHGRNLWSVAI